jgi:hypothetical protein
MTQKRENTLLTKNRVKIGKSGTGWMDKSGQQRKKYLMEIDGCFYNVEIQVFAKQKFDPAFLSFEKKGVVVFSAHKF